LIIFDQKTAGPFDSLIANQTKTGNFDWHCPRIFAASSTSPRGSWNAPMDESAHDEKLSDCLNYGLPGPAGEKLIEQLNRLDMPDAQAVRSIIAMMSVRR
jgi:hypothetical protein